MFHVAVCDDEIGVRNQIQHYFSQLSATTRYSFDVHVFPSGEKLLRHYKAKALQEKYTYHLLILDIEMTGMNGLETAREIRSIPDREVQIMFLTSYPEYMLQSFDVQTFQYLLKPVPYQLFERKILKLCSYILSSEPHFFTIKTEEGHIVLRKSEIIAIVKIKHSLAQNKLQVITATNQYTFTGKLLEYADKTGGLFLMIHRSIIINLEHVRRFTATSVWMSNGENYPIGRSQSKTIKDIYAQYMITQLKERG